MEMQEASSFQVLYRSLTNVPCFHHVMINHLGFEDWLLNWASLNIKLLVHAVMQLASRLEPIQSSMSIPNISKWIVILSVMPMMKTLLLTHIFPLISKNVDIFTKARTRDHYQFFTHELMHVHSPTSFLWLGRGLLNILNSPLDHHTIQIFEGHI